MNDDRIERMLREGYPAPDAGAARSRILERAARELRPARTRAWFRAKWAFAAAAVILFANVSDHGRQIRLSRGLDGTPVRTISDGAAMIERQRLAREMLAWAKCGPGIEKQKEGQL